MIGPSTYYIQRESVRGKTRRSMGRCEYLADVEDARGYIIGGDRWASHWVNARRYATRADAERDRKRVAARGWHTAVIHEQRDSRGGWLYSTP